jgi:mono/diheme cytochrome c family protein
MRKGLNKTLVRAALTWGCVTFAAGAVWSAQASDGGSQGWQIPEGADAERNPVPVDAAVLARGQRLYKSNCQRCHGMNGNGAGPDADPNHVPGDLTDARRASRNPDGVMFYKIWNGRAKPKMPAMKTDIARNDVWTVIHYVKTLRRSAPASR